ncbi:translation initiation factor IF-2 [Streptomyces sp. NPDC059477]|uniref:WXG100 family type VII secretion target n=1 Tax=Streptomyces sp. NPDC059477 TaxID=3346847 RepID=UPI00368011ED
MANGGAGDGGTPFESMSHEQMLAWLDQANAGTVQAAADRLIAVANEIHKIAEELKVRPQWVEWKGEGADAFRTWAGDLANATLRLGDFSEESASWLSRASTAIAQAQIAIPRDMPSAEANLAAATEARNDPDARTISTEAAIDLAALRADRERVRQDAAAEMRKLAQTYQVSATQLNGLERPRFPPPPEAFVPGDPENRYAMESIARPGGGEQMASDPGGTVYPATYGGADGTTESGSPSSSRPVSASVPPDHVRSPAPDPVETQVEVNAVETMPDGNRTSPGSTATPPGPSRAEGGGPLLTGPVPPAFGGKRTPDRATGPVRAVGTGRTPPLPGGGPVASATGRTTGVTGRTTGVPGGGSQGIVGGRPTTPAEGRTSGIPRGVVVGGETQGSRGAAGPGGAPAGQPLGRPTGPQAPATSGRAPLPASGALPRNGVVGGSPQQQPGRSDGRSPGTSGSGISGSTNAARGGIAGGIPSDTRTGSGGRGATMPQNRTTRSRRDNRHGERRSATEDEETRRPNDGRRIVPPVID